MKLNLGCGRKHKEGYVNVDYDEDCEPDIVVDLNEYPYPFKTESVKQVFSDNVCEHLNDFTAHLNEIYRILRPKGSYRFIVPFYNTRIYNWDPTHKIRFSYESMQFYCDNVECGTKYVVNKFVLIDKKINKGRLGVFPERVNNLLSKLIPEVYESIEFVIMKKDDN